jgi:hypothetical protein
MSINLEALEADLDATPLPRGAGGHVCLVQALVAEHPEAEEVLRRALADTRRSHKRTAEILTRNGLKISETTVRKHRNGTCTVCRMEREQAELR